MFEKATRTAKFLKMGFAGPSGSGKTYSMLQIATHLIPLLTGTEEDNGRIALIDTEGGSAAMYAGDFDFDMVTLDSFSPEKYAEAINAAVIAHYPIIIIDSLSHLWAGKDGLLETVDKVTASSRSKNTFSEGWKKMTPKYNKFVGLLMATPAHMLLGLRSKADYVMEKNDRGRTVPVKVGLAPIMRSEFTFELDVLARMEHGTMFVEKTRILQLGMDYEIFHPGEETAKIIAEWQSSETPPTESMYVNSLDWPEFQKFVTSRVGISREDLAAHCKSSFGDDWASSMRSKKSEIWDSILKWLE